MKQVIFLFLMCFITSSLAGQEAELFSSANAAYQQADYTKAIANYQEILASGKVSTELYYNLGNAHLKAKQIGPAILNYERALRLSPSDNNTLQNLSLAKEEIATPITEIPEFFLLRFWKGFACVFSPVVWIILQLITAILFLYGCYLWRLSGIENQKLRGFVIMVISGLCLLMAYLAGRTASNETTRKDAGIVMMNESLRSGPDSRADEIETLSSGVKVKILDTIDDWHKVSLVNKEQGWIQGSAVEII